MPKKITLFTMGAGCKRCGATESPLIRTPRKYEESRGLCKPCAHLIHGRAYNRRPIGIRNGLKNNFNRLYGITTEQFDEMRVAQDFRCAVCQAHEDVLKKVLHKRQPGRLTVDHDHNSGQIRKLLCRGCNTMLGHAKDSPDILRAGAAYLDAWVSRGVDRL